MMDAKIETVRWYWRKVRDLRVAVMELCKVMGVEYVECDGDRVQVEMEIEELDKLLEVGFTHFVPVRKGG